MNNYSQSDRDRGARNRFKTAPFNYQRSTRLTLANLQVGSEVDGAWIIFNVGDYVHISPYNATHKDPYKSIQFTSPVRTGYPTCHAYLSARDGVDLLVGLGDGTVMLLSLRVQLSTGSKPAPVPVATLTPEGVSETTRVTAVAWVPRSDAGLFVAAYSSGNIYVYKKAGAGRGRPGETHLTGEGSGKFSLSLGSRDKAQAPSSTIQISGGGINDVAVSPDGRQLAAACRDGALRLLDLATGTVQCGFSSYYGALLCAAFSPDGKYVATGGEDDLVAVAGTEPGSGSRTSLTEQLAPATRIYRLGSAGQDCQLCLWDVQAPGEGDINSGAALLAQMSIAGGGGMKRNGSMGMLGGSNPRMSVGGLEAGSGHGGHDRKASLGKSTGICPSLPRLDMAIVQPIMEHKLHAEPMSDLLFTEGAIFTADHSGNIRTWARPQQDGGSSSD
ncbi:hypothetical protein GPECTOR_1g553 [Gonium pectorale]|uniref:Uncharacterized protein n=1 Tax=Gonium pectorale TaxID=33097 RepID=A0A150H3I3_GONPE|nr:hypothetical protein GPECTOR_1g553 [Gonium pectorale]|eukprot:KXZ56614.1 hypothetical protein GPECTOR_1g553 [Gonium pectorale]